MRFLIYLCLSLLPYSLWAQADHRIPLHSKSSEILKRLEITSGAFIPHHHSHLSGLRSKAALRFVDSLTAQNRLSSPIDKENVTHILSGQVGYLDSTSQRALQSTRPVLKHFYQTPAYLWTGRTGTHWLHINPLLHLQGGQAQQTDASRITFLNRRGVSIQGAIDDKVYFYSALTENQVGFPEYIEQKTNARSAVPGAAFYKTYDSRFTDGPNDGFDYLLAEGYIGFNLTPHIGAEFGYGTHKLGHGYRSLWLSDFSTNHLYLTLNTRVGPIHYQNIFSELIRDYTRGTDQILPKKYMAAHVLSVQVLKNLTLTAFEATVFGRDNGFELAYLNPIIFYRAVEQALGSPDNAMLGFSASYQFLHRFRAYGQLIFDEFKFDELFVKRDGWWANKYGIQLGLDYVNAFGIDQLDLKAEYNLVRPYTYTFRDSSATYSHYNQPLAHPLGANFTEFLFRARYQPAPRWQLEGRIHIGTQGLDTLQSNWGSNIHLPYNTRMREYQNTIGQGVQSKWLLARLDVAYQWKHNLFLEAFAQWRQRETDIELLNQKSFWWGLGLRWNIAARPYAF